MPITTRDDELTVDQMHLSDMVVTGVLNIFAVERKHTDSRGSEAIGKDAIFAADDHWVCLTIAFWILTDRLTASESATVGTWYGYISLLPSRCFRDDREEQGGPPVPGRSSAHG